MVALTVLVMDEPQCILCNRFNRPDFVYIRLKGHGSPEEASKSASCRKAITRRYYESSRCHPREIAVNPSPLPLPLPLSLCVLTMLIVLPADDAAWLAYVGGHSK